MSGLAPCASSALVALAEAALASFSIELIAGECVLVDNAVVEVLRAGDVYLVDHVRGHRCVQGQMQFFVVYAGYETERPSWQPLHNFLLDGGRQMNSVVEQYCTARGLCLRL